MPNQIKYKNQVYRRVATVNYPHLTEEVENEARLVVTKVTNWLAADAVDWRDYTGTDDKDAAADYLLDTMSVWTGAEQRVRSVAKTILKEHLF